MAQPPLNQQTLVQIWNLSNRRQTPGHLLKEDFYCSLRYMAIAQAGQPVSLQTLRKSNGSRLGLPRISGFDNAKIIQSYKRSGGRPNYPPYVQQQQQPQPAPVPVPAPVPAQQPQQAAAPQNTTTPAATATDPWTVSPQQKEQYLKFFFNADRDRDGFVSGQEAADFFRMSGLHQQVLKEIWLLSDLDKDSKLDKTEFVIAVHLAMKARTGMQPPKVLPPSLLSLKRGTVVSAALPQQAQPRKSDDLVSSLVANNKAKAPPLRKMPSAIALDDETLIPLKSSIKAAQTQHDDFDEELKLNNQKLTESLSEVAELKAKLVSLGKETVEIKQKIADGEEELNHLQEQKNELLNQVEDRQDTVAMQKDTLAILESKLQAARKAYNEKNRTLIEQNNAMSMVNQSASEMEAEIERLRREEETLDGKIARYEKLLQSAKQRGAECEERKKSQQEIINEKKAHLARIRGQLGDSKNLISSSKRELESLKLESKQLREQIRAVRSGQGGVGFFDSKTSVDAEIQSEKKNVAELKAQLASAKGGVDPASTDDIFDGADDPFTPTSTNEVKNTPTEEISAPFDTDNFDMDNLDNDNPFASNPFETNDGVLDAEPITEPTVTGETTAAATETKGSADAVDPFAEDDPFAAEIATPAPVATTTAKIEKKEEEKKESAGDFFEEAGFDFNVPVAAPKATEAPAATPAVGAAAQSEEPAFELDDMFGPAPTVERKKVEAAPSALNGGFDDDDDVFGAANGASASPKPAQNEKKSEPGFDDDDDIFGTSIPAKAAPKKTEEKAAPPASQKAQNTVDDFDDDVFGSALPASSSAAKSQPEASKENEENPFSAAGFGGGADAADEDNPFDSSAAPSGGATKKKDAGTSNAAFAADFGEDEFKF
eukprot:CAMPEP_0167753044 /NCGR_PEP_ID=MMETSP0110_2-20121227/7489_1 /TAXON_ID=629695 /ORGANISM="Gymnochlora sp., Strain CCMP2014" /LENGTH=886 /DNA_ID=CAMNT_0007638755 /DNA_START=80 /DNA_END=2740 /DNA_ORIENTATION=+